MTALPQPFGRLSIAIAMLALLAIAIACGSAHKSNPPWVKPIGGGAGAPEAFGRVARPPEKPTSTLPLQPGAGAPIETFMVGAALPERLAARSVSVRFRANVDDARFECKLTPGSTSFVACPDANAGMFTFENLVQGQGWHLQIRARAVDGRVDETPLVVAFLVDFIQGLPPPSEATAGEEMPTVGPPAIPPRPVLTAGEGAPRRLALGSFYALEVPAPFLVTSYSTSKTISTKLHWMRLIGGDASVYRDEPCTREWEREVPGPDGSLYCDATPTLDQLANYYRSPQPHNHLEMLMAAGPITYERIFVAAFDGEFDPGEAGLGLGASCQSANASGRILVPGLVEFFLEPSQRELMAWCQIRMPDGEWWYIGSFIARARTSIATIAPRLTVTYAANARLGLFSGQSFAQRVGETMQALLKPTAPLP